MDNYSDKNQTFIRRSSNAMSESEIKSQLTLNALREKYLGKNRDKDGLESSVSYASEDDESEANMVGSQHDESPLKDKYFNPVVGLGRS